jgi:hypothetical protein
MLLRNGAVGFIDWLGLVVTCIQATNGSCCFVHRAAVNNGFAVVCDRRDEYRRLGWLFLQADQNRMTTAQQFAHLPAVGLVFRRERDRGNAAVRIGLMNVTWHGKKDPTRHQHLNGGMTARTADVQ